MYRTLSSVSGYLSLGGIDVGADNSCCGAVLHIGYLAASLSSSHQMPVAPSHPPHPKFCVPKMSLDIAKYSLEETLGGRKGRNLAKPICLRAIALYEMLYQTLHLIIK